MAKSDAVKEGKWRQERKRGPKEMTDKEESVQAGRG